MVWAVLAAFLTKKPPAVQAAVLGLSLGLFVAAAAEADKRDSLLSSMLAIAVVTGAFGGRPVRRRPHLSTTAPVDAR